MYKLVVIGGKMRGKEFILQDGENILGRDPSSEIYIPIDGISKKHLSITVTEDVAYLKDLGSSNGTFVNGVLTSAATVQNKDKISLPDTIIQVVYVTEKKVIVKKQISTEDAADLNPYEEVPKALPRKIIYYFKQKAMPPINNLNKEWEWRIMLAVVVVLCVIISILITIYPALQESRKLLLYETAQRGSQYADEITRLNQIALSKGDLDKIRTSFLDDDKSVESYELFDLKGRIYRPLVKLNEFVSDPFSVNAKNWARDPKYAHQEKYLKIIGENEIGIARKIDAPNLETGMMDTIAVIAIRFKPTSLIVEQTKSTKALTESLVTAILVAILFYGIIYFLTLRPLEEIRRQIEEALRGKRRNLEVAYLMEEINPLCDSINAILQRNRELQKEEGEVDFDNLESDESYVQKFISILQGLPTPAIVLDSEKNLKKLNIEAEDLTGIRESSSMDMSLLNTAREKGFAATIIDLCDDAANSGGLGTTGQYEIQGNQYEIRVNCLMGKDNFAKSFLITFRQGD